MTSPAVSPLAGACPPREVLAHFNAGLLPDDRLEAVAEHVATCPPCEATLHTLHAEDALVGRLRNGSGLPDVSSEPEYLRMEAAARATVINPIEARTGLYLPPGLAFDRAGEDQPHTLSFGPYQLLAQIGQGGMGIVYKARQAHLQRPVALKLVLAGAFAGEEALARFRVEAQAVARLQHPNVIQIFDYGEHQGQPYFSMEFLEGGSLARKLAGVPQAPAEAARMVQTLARAVHAAHRQRIVHRDLKPANVLLTADGTPKISDFGLAKLLDDEQSHTQSEAVLGTPSYMAPEQARGDTRAIGPLVDVYALGAILYELLSGRPPYRGANRAETLELVKSQELVPPSRHCPRIPRGLEAICLKSLEKSPARRYPSAEDLAEDLARWLRGEAPLVRPARWPVRLGRTARRHPLVSGTLAALVAGLAAALAAWIFLDPDRPIDKIEDRLADGERVVLIGATGGPSWARWRIGGEAVKSFEAPDGFYSLSAWKRHGLLELVRDPQQTRFRLQAEVRHETSDDFGEVGLYVAGTKTPAGPGTIHSFLQFTYNDIKDDMDVYNRLPPQTKKHVPPPTGNRVRLNQRLLVPGQMKPIWDVRLSGLDPELFKPEGFAGGKWRKLALEVTPEQVRGYWAGDKAFGELSSDDIQKNLESKLSLPGLAKKRSGISLRGVRRGFEPRGSLGLYVFRGSASFRNVIIEPMTKP
jgi:tRNA A-37 threonylcarbamoyl transferase component Bud32